MSICTRALFAACFTGLVGLSHAASAATIVSQQPCDNGSGACLSFNNTDPIPIIRTIRFNAPGAGTASVSFHGSIFCTSSSATDDVVDLVMQIVPRGNQAPAANGPGGLRLATVLKDEVDHSFDSSTSFNLASTRVFNVDGAGRQNYHFKIERLRMDPTTNCFVYNAVFTVIFVP
jgi:hypothetical protein